MLVLNNWLFTIEVIHHLIQSFASKMINKGALEITYNFIKIFEGQWSILNMLGWWLELANWQFDMDLLEPKFEGRLLHLRHFSLEDGTNNSQLWWKHLYSSRSKGVIFPFSYGKKPKTLLAMVIKSFREILSGYSSVYAFYLLDFRRMSMYSYKINRYTSWESNWNNIYIYATIE